MIIRKPPSVNFEKDKIICLTDGGSRDEVIAQYVQHRLNQLKCPPSFRREMGEEFVVELPSLRNPLPKTAAYKMASAKIRAAVAAKKKIVLFGDYDCDGVISVALLHDFLRAAGLPASKLDAFIPLRHVHGYGLTMPAVQRCVKMHRPELLIVLDCGTNSREEIDWLTEQGIDSVIVDHHLPAESKTADTTLLNPKAWAGSKDNSWDLQLLSAAGLAFLLVHGMADELRLTSWDSDRAILMAGLASYVDLMPVVGLNRILVKHSLRLARRADGLGKIPGLAALEELRQASKFTAGVLDEKTFGLFFGPCLNAPGRLGDAKDALCLLLAEDAAAARKTAGRCFNLNEQRKKIQSPLTERALGAAGKLKDTKVIFLADKKCHPGVGGIVASDVKEAFNRPAIIASWQKADNDDGGFWKASGRSIEQCNLGGIIQDAVAQNVIEGGGGHEMAGAFHSRKHSAKK
jgi:single-stranded-DNA-specific exonuclease